MRALGRSIFVLIGSLLLTPAAAFSQTVTALWDASPVSESVLNYEVCISTTPLSCNIQRATVPASQTSYTFSLTPGVINLVAVRAFSALGAGEFSQEVAVSIPAIASVADQTSTVNTPINPLSVPVNDPDGSTLTFSHTGLPLGLSLNSGTGAITGTPTSIGTYSVTVLVSDGLVTVSTSFVWTVRSGSSDATPPNVDISSHTNGQQVTNATITLQGTASDAGAGDSGISSVRVNGVLASGGTSSGGNTATWSRALTLVQGSNQLTVVATDGAGNARTTQISVTYSVADTSAPSLSITSHTTGQTVNVASITLAGTATDMNSGNSGIASVTINGTAASGGTSTGANMTTWSGTVALAQGPNFLTVVATDGAGNARQVSLTINRDSAAPALAITSHSSGQTVSTTTITLSGTATDSGAGGSGITQVTVNGATASGGTASGSNTANWSRSVSVNGGTNLYTVVATDGAGNTRTAAISLTFSAPAAPMTAVSLSTSLPSPQPLGTTIFLTAAGSGGSGPYEYRFWAHHITSPWEIVQDWNPSATYAWAPTRTGSFEVAVWGRRIGSTAEWEAYSARAFEISTGGSSDGTAPSLNITSHSSGQTLTAADITLGGTASDNDSGNTGIVSVTVNGQLASGGTANGAGTANWSRSFTLSSGANTITVAARDGAGNVRTSSITLTYTSSGSGSGSGVSGSPMTSVALGTNLLSPQPLGSQILLTAVGAGGSGPYEYRFWAHHDSSEWEIVRDWSTTATYSWMPTRTGTHEIAVWGRRAGSGSLWEAYAQTVYVVSPGSLGDALPPTVTITSHSAGQTLTTQTITLSGTATDSGSGGTGIATVTVDGQQTTGGAASGTGTANWSRTLSLAPGANTIWVAAADGAGNVRMAPITLTYLTVTVSGSPMTSVSVSTNPNSGEVGEPVMIFAAGAGGTGPYEYRFWLHHNTEEWAIVRDYGTGSMYTFTPGRAGTYEIAIWARRVGSSSAWEVYTSQPFEVR